MAVKNLIFDIGGVLVGYRPEEMLRDYGMTPEQIRLFAGKVLEDPLWSEFDRGICPYEEVVERYQQKYPDLKESIRWLFGHTYLMPVYRYDVWAKLHQLKQAGYRIYLLSNYSREFFESHFHGAAFLEDVDGEVISWQVHTIKPEEGIYRALLEKYDLKAKESVFFDDRRENVDQAERMGIRGWHITDKGQLLALMDQYLRQSRLPRALCFEEEAEKLIAPWERPAFHLSPRAGWMNDPNGFSVYQGKYHLFYQYYPYDTHWGPMHWGHAVSTDLLHWTYLPAALAPDQLYDRDGCFSGGAIELPDGRQLLMYTAVDRTAESGAKPVDRQTQALALGDGVRYEKWSANPVLEEKDLPEGASIADFRDPKLVRLPDGSYRAYCVTLMAKRGGALVQYESRDGMNWRFRSTMTVNDFRIGKMWECPDFFEMDGAHIFLASAQDMQAQGLEYDNGNGTFVMIGNYDEKTGVFTPKADQCVDYGLDFYAEQTTVTPDGRRVMIAWMQNWDTCQLRTGQPKWYGMMTLPREIFLRNGRFCQRPVRELEKLRGERVSYENVRITDQEITLEKICGRRLDLELELEKEGEEVFSVFALRFARDEQFHTDLIFRPREQTLEIDRRFSGTRRAAIHQRKAPAPYPEGRLKIRLILDRFSAEAFVEDGETAMSVTLPTAQTAEGISFFAQGAVRLKVTAYPLEDKTDPDGNGQRV